MRDTHNLHYYTSLNMSWKSLVAVAASLFAASIAIAEPPVVRLQDAVDAAIASGDELRIVNGNLEAARAQNEVARSKGGLSLSGSGSYSLTDGFGGDLASGASASSLAKLLGSSGATQNLQGSLSLSSGNLSSSNPFSKLSLSAAHSLPPPTGTPTTTLGASLAQTLWDGYPGGQTKASIEKASLAYQIKELAAAQSRSTVAVNVKKAYVTMLTAQRTFALRTGVLDKQRVLLKQIETTYALKQASAIDLMTAQINVRGAELDLDTAAHDLALARQRLANLMGKAPDSDFSVAEIDEPPLPAASAAEAVTAGLAKRADAAQIALNRRSAAIDLALAKSGSQPGVSMTAGITMGMIEGTAPATAGSASLGAKISLPVLDAGATASQTAAAAAQLAVYEAQAAQLSKGIAADISDAYWSATILYNRIGLAKMSQDLYENKLALAKTQFQFGTATNQDLLTAQADSANAAAAYLAAKGAYLLQELALETAMGM
jgi:outer membrane protein